MPLVFVYGTLKRGGRNHAQMSGGRFVGPARTQSGWALHDLGSYPGMVPAPDAPEGIVGELWEISDPLLAKLDRFEGVHEGLYRRETLALAEPTGTTAFAYVYLRPLDGHRRLGAEWRE